MASFDITGPTYYYGNIASRFIGSDDLPIIDIFDALKVLDVVTNKDGLYTETIDGVDQWKVEVPILFRRLCNIKSKPKIGQDIAIPSILDALEVLDWATVKDLDHDVNNPSALATITYNPIPPSQTPTTTPTNTPTYTATVTNTFTNTPTQTPTNTTTATQTVSYTHLRAHET